MVITNKTLMKIASIGGIITCSTGLALLWKNKQEIRNSEFYKEAIKEFRNNPKAVSLLGEPVKEYLSMNSNTHLDNEKAYFEVKLHGAKQKGTLHFWATRNNELNKWNVNRIELGLQNEPDRRVLIKQEN